MHLTSPRAGSPVSKPAEVAYTVSLQKTPEISRKGNAREEDGGAVDYTILDDVFFFFFGIDTTVQFGAPLSAMMPAGVQCTLQPTVLPAVQATGGNTLYLLRLRSPFPWLSDPRSPLQISAQQSLSLNASRVLAILKERRPT